MRRPAYSKGVFALVYLAFLAFLPTHSWVWIWWGNLPVLAFVTGFPSEEISGDPIVFAVPVLFWAFLYAVSAWVVAAMLETEVSLWQRRVAVAGVLLSCVIVGLGTNFVFCGSRLKEGNLFESYTMLWTLRREPPTARP